MIVCTVSLRSGLQLGPGNSRGKYFGSILDTLVQGSLRTHVPLYIGKFVSHPSC